MIPSAASWVACSPQVLPQGIVTSESPDQVNLQRQRKLDLEGRSPVFLHKHPAFGDNIRLQEFDLNPSMVPNSMHEQRYAARLLAYVIHASLHMRATFAHLILRTRGTKVAERPQELN